MFAIDLSTIVDIATVGSILILAYQVSMERKADRRNAEEQMKADRRYAEERKEAEAKREREAEELLKNQIRLLCITWCSCNKRDFPDAQDVEVSQGIRISNNSDTIFKDFRIEASRILHNKPYYVMKKPKGTDKTIFIPSNESEAHNGKAHYQRGSNNNLYAQKITAYTPFLFPGDYYISIKRGEFPDDKAEEADGTPFSPFASFIETRFLDKEDLHLEPISASAGSGGEKTIQKNNGLPKGFSFKATCSDIRGQDWKIDSTENECKWTSA